MNRRNLLKFGGLAAAGALLPLERIADAIATPAAAPVVPVFGAPLTVPPVLRPSFRFGRTDFYEITMREQRVEILPGTRTPVWGYNGIFPTCRCAGPRSSPSRCSRPFPRGTSTC